MKTLRILGTRGVPAAHGGFETFAEQLALHLVRTGWRVIVYCQETGQGPVQLDEWCGVERVRMACGADTPASTIGFDWKATRHAAASRDLCLTLGYNTAVFCALLRLAGVTNVINMDGIEWRRAKWGAVAKLWFWLNERAGSLLGNHLVADHPEIARHLQRAAPAAKITMIPYGAERLAEVDASPLQAYGLQPGRYATLIARPEPENSVLEAVRGWSARPRGQTLAVLGGYRQDHAYHRAVRAAAGPEVQFCGPIYDKPILRALRAHCTLYVHGHQVGGTNPSLVESLGAGNAVIAHDNAFNRWVAQDAAVYFDGAKSFSSRLEAVLDNASQLEQMRAAARRRFEAEFQWEQVLQAYDRLLTQHVMR